MASSSANSHSGNSQKQQDGVVVAPATSTTSSQQSVLSRRTLQMLAKEVDPNVQLDEETEDILLNYADDVLEKIIEGACELAVHRKSGSLDVQDVQTYLERQNNMWITSETKDGDLTKIQRKNLAAEAHRQRMALIKKNLKKY